MKLPFLLGILAPVALLVPTACGSSGPVAEALLVAKSGSQVSGTARFESDGTLVTLKVGVVGVPPGQHAVHIHEKGDCSDPGALTAGAHWNFKHQMHGQPGAAQHHAGEPQCKWHRRYLGVVQALARVAATSSPTRRSSSSTRGPRKPASR